MTWPEGVEPLEHTADAGLLAEGATLADLFSRAALGMRRLVEGEDRAEPAAALRDGPTLDLEADDVAVLLVEWLRELLFLHQTRGRAFAGATFERLTETTLRARLRTCAAATRPAREVKGVTYHGLLVTSDGAWRARVFFDL